MIIMQNKKQNYEKHFNHKGGIHSLAMLSIKLARFLCSRFWIEHTKGHKCEGRIFGKF